MSDVVPLITLSEFARQHLRISYAGHDLDRVRVLREIRMGHRDAQSVSDAGPHLINSAEVLGTPAQWSCPLCAKEKVRIIHWIHGVGLGEKSGTARSVKEIPSVVDAFVDAAVDSEQEMSIHSVEVCLNCKWNYLLREDNLLVHDS